MPRFKNYQRSNDKDNTWLNQENRADSVQWMIDRDGVSITLLRDGVAQTAQTCIVVRPGSSSRGRESRHETGESANYDVILIGIRDHSNTSISDFDVARGDLFNYQSIQYEVIDVVKVDKGKTEANCKARL